MAKYDEPVVLSNADLGQHIRRLDKRIKTLGKVVDLQQQSIEGLVETVKSLTDKTSTPVTLPGNNFPDANS